MTNKEKEAIVKAAFPNIDDTSLSFAAYLVEDGDTVATYKNRVKEQPKVLAGTVFSPKDILKVGPALAKGGTKVAEFTKAKFAKKAAEEGVKTAAKMSKKKKLAIGGLAIYAGSEAAGSIASAMGGNKDETDTSGMTQAELDMANAVAAANAAGLDVNSLIASPGGQQLNLNANNLPAFMAKFGQSTAGFVGIGNVGIFTGVEIDKEVPRRKFGGTLTVPTKELVQLPDWNKRFPVDAAGLASTKQKFVDAGVLAPTDGIDKIKAAWEAYGKMSLEYSRAGHNVSPWELLALQKGLSGSGSQTTTTIDVSPIAETDIKNTAKRQLAVSLGLANIDDAMYKDIVSIVRKNEAKRPTKTVRTTTGNTTKVKTTPGYGTSDVLADVEEYAKKDPRYAEFQTADVFGNAMIKALGLKA
jgi:hypothetical protein